MFVTTISFYASSGRKSINNLDCEFKNLLERSAKLGYANIFYWVYATDVKIK